MGSGTLGAAVGSSLQHQGCGRGAERGEGEAACWEREARDVGWRIGHAHQAMGEGPDCPKIMRN